MPGLTARRVAAVGLTAVASAVEATLAWRLISSRPLGVVPATLLCLLAFVGVLLGMVAWRPRPDATDVRGHASLLQLGAPLAGVVGLVAVAALAGTGHVLPLAAAVTVWCCLGVAAVAAARSRLAVLGGGPYGWEALLPAGLLLLVLVVLVPVLGTSGFAALVENLGALGGFVALVVIPTAVAGEGVEGASGFRDRAARVEALTARRPGLVPLVLGAKLVGILLVAGVARLLRPGWSYLLSSGRIWLLALLLALLATSVLLVERRLAVSAADQRALVRGPVLLLAAGLGALVGLALLEIVGFVAVSVPLATVCLAVLVVGVVALVHQAPHRTGRWAYGVAVVAAGLGALVAHRDDLPGLPTHQRWMDDIRFDFVLAAGGILSAAVWLLVRCDRRRRRRLVLLGLGLLAWMVLVLTSQRLAPGWSLLNLDLTLWAILVVGWATWRLGLQRALDGFEVVQAAVATSLVLGAAILLEGLGSRFAGAVLAVTLVGPGLVASVRLWRPRAGEGQDARPVGRACTLYALLMPVVVLTGPDTAAVLDQVSSLLVNLLVLPLVLLLLASASAARAVQGNPGDAVRAGA